MTADFYRIIQQDLKPIAQPFAPMAEELGITVEELLQRLAALKQDAVIKRYGARINHHKAGYRYNVMAVWRVTPNASNIRIIKRCVRDLPQISHCYFRPAAKNFPFNLYTMIHGKSRAEIMLLTSELQSRLKVALQDCVFLTTLKEFKKVPFQLP